MAGSHSVGPLHQLWPPPGDNRSTECDVVFFHGLQFTADDTGDAWRSTWTQRGNECVCWPEKWLPLDFRGALRVFSISYNADVATCPHDHVSEIAHNVFQILMDRRCTWHQPIVLVGHSFGGLVLKSLVVKLVAASALHKPTNPLSEETLHRAKVFLKNVKGVAFYAVPHSGSNIAEYVKLLRCNIKQPGIMDNVQPWQRNMEELSVEFDDIVTENEINIYAFCEGRPMEEVGILVEVSSAQRSARGHFYKVEDANHMEVCKPLSKQDLIYSRLVQLIELCQQVPREYDQHLQDSHDFPHTMFGMESYVKTVGELVISGGRNAAPRYVGVYGMGGVGKSLLLQRVYGSEAVRGHFQGAKFIWLTLGQTPDIMALYRTLSAELGLEPEKTETPKDYKLKLFNQFKLRRVFLVLDDVWKVEAFNSLDLAGGKGSVTMLSTRDQSILDRISRVNFSQQEMLPLLKEDSWSLFCAHAFKRLSNVPSELEAVARLVAEECQGLPLALKVIGGAMCGKVNRKYEWEPLLKNVCMARRLNVEEELYERLRLSYDLLSEDDCRLKLCFHYFAAFPEDSIIIFEEILFHWTAEKLVPENDGDDPVADAFCLLKKLWERSLIESNEQFSSDKSYVLKFKVHDVMRDLALYILEKDSGTPAKELYFYRAGRNWGDVPKDWKTLWEARRISLDTNELEKLPDNFRAPNLVSLLLGRNPIISLPANFSSNFPMLNVLNLRNGQFHSLPDELGDLMNLVCLDLSNCHNLERLPNTVRNLQELKFLILDDCWSLKYLPSGVVDLTSLQVLHTAQCSSLIWAENALSWAVRAGVSGHLHITVGASLENVCRLLFLTELTISTKELFDIPELFKQFRDEVANNIYSPTTLQFVQLSQLDMELPHNFSSLTKLLLLQLTLEIKTLPAEIAYCQQLQELEVFSTILECIPRSFTSCGAFPALIKLQLCSLKLLQFPEMDAGAMCKLQILNLSNCQRLEILPLSLQVLTSLRNLILVDCNNKLQNCCRRNCARSAIWRKFNIQYEQSSPTENDNERKYTFHSRHNLQLTVMNVEWRM